MMTGDRIKELRIQKGMSQEELGTKIGVKKAAINKYESGVVVNLKRSTIAKLASALDTSPIYLMGWEENKDAVPISEDGKSEILSIFGSLSPDRRSKLLELARLYLDDQRKIEETE